MSRSRQRKNSIRLRIECLEDRAVPAAVALSVIDTQAGEPGTDTASVALTREGDTSAGLVVTLQKAGTATISADYNWTTGGQMLVWATPMGGGPATTTVTFAAGESSVTLTLTAVNDTEVEVTETAVVEVVAQPGYEVGTPSSATLYIADDESSPEQTGHLIVEAYDDQNTNGLWDTEEPGVAVVGVSYAGQDPGNSGVTGELVTDSTGTDSVALTIGDYDYDYDVSIPEGYDILVPVALFGELTIANGQSTTLQLPLALLTESGEDPNAPDPEPSLFAYDDLAMLDEGGSLSIAVLANDVGYVGGPTIASSPGHGTVLISGSQISYTAGTGYNGYDSFTYTVTDGEDTVEGTVEVIIQEPVDQSLQATDDSGFTKIGTPLSLTVLENDLNFVGGIASIVQPSHGAIAVNGSSIIYTPAIGYFGTDTFSYTIGDGNGNFDTAVVEVAVQVVAVDIDINATVTVTDDVAIVDEPIPVLVTFHASTGAIPQPLQLRLSDPSPSGAYIPSSRAVFPSTSGTTMDITLADGQSTTIYVRATSSSLNPADILVQAYFFPPLFQGNPPKVGEKPMDAILTPLVGSYYGNEELNHYITATTTTPLQMSRKQYRIPPRRDTPFWVKIGKVAPERVINVYLIGNSVANGKAEIKAAGNVPWAGVTTLALKGNQFGGPGGKWHGPIRGIVDGGQVFQTQPGNAGRLGLGVSVGAVPATPSSQLFQGFSVASNPISVTISGAEKQQVADTGLGGAAEYDFAWGAKHTVAVASDSGQTADLDMVYVSRLRFVRSTSGYFAGIGPRSMPPILAKDHSAVLSATFERIPKAGNTEAQAKVLATQRFKQRVDNANNAGVLDSDGYYIFNDNRTNPAGNPADQYGMLFWDLLPKSGFKVKMTVSKAGTVYKVKIDVTSQGSIINEGVTVSPGGASVAPSASATVELEEVF